MRKHKKLLALCMVAAIIVGSVNVAVANKTDETDRKTQTVATVDLEDETEESSEAEEESTEASEESEKDTDLTETEESSTEETEESSEEETTPAESEEEESTESEEGGEKPEDDESEKAADDEGEKESTEAETTEALIEESKEAPKKLQKVMLAAETSQENAVASVGDVYYETLAEAIENADGETVKLEKSVDISESGLEIAEGTSITLDLNNQELMVANTTKGRIVVKGSLTLLDSQVELTGFGYGKIISKKGADTGNVAAIKVEGGSFTMKSGIIDTSRAKKHSAVGVFGADDGAFIMENGTIVADAFALTGNGMDAYNDFTINNGTLRSISDYAIYFPQEDSSLTIEDGYFEGAAGAVAINNGTLTINGGEFLSRDTAKLSNEGSDGTYGMKNAVLNVTARYGNLEVTITGGEFKAENNALIIGDAPEASDKLDITISGEATKFFGNDAAIASVNKKEYLEKGFELTQNDDGSYGVQEGTPSGVAEVDGTYYASLQDAVNAADGKTVRLVNDTDVSEKGLIILNSVTLDMNGKELTVANTANGRIVVTGSLTLKDSSATGTDGIGKGKIVSSEATPGANVVAVKVEGGSFVMKSGVIDTTGAAEQSAVGVFGAAGGTFTMEGGKIKADAFALSGNGMHDDNDFRINGGSLISKNDYAVYFPQKGELTVTDGYVEGAAGAIAMNDGKLDISGGEFVSLGTAKFDESGSDGTYGMHNAVLNVMAEYGKLEVSISGGTFTAKGDALILGDAPKDAEKLTVEISGAGTKFYGDAEAIKSVNNDSYFAEGFELKKNADGSYGVREEGEEPQPEPEKPTEPETPSRPSTGGGSYGGGGGSSVGKAYVSGEAQGSWKQDASGWQFTKTDGSMAKNEWYSCEWNKATSWYHFNEQGYMQDGWFTDVDGRTYFLHNVSDNTRGRMYTGWNWIGGKCYFFETQSGNYLGHLYKNCQTPDGNTVNENGEWTVNGVVQTR